MGECPGEFRTSEPSFRRASQRIHGPRMPTSFRLLRGKRSRELMRAAKRSNIPDEERGHFWSPMPLAAAGRRLKFTRHVIRLQRFGIQSAESTPRYGLRGYGID